MRMNTKTPFLPHRHNPLEFYHFYSWGRGSIFLALFISLHILLISLDPLPLMSRLISLLGCLEGLRRCVVVDRRRWSWETLTAGGQSTEVFARFLSIPPSTFLPRHLSILIPVTPSLSQHLSPYVLQHPPHSIPPYTSFIIPLPSSLTQHHSFSIPH